MSMFFKSRNRCITDEDCKKAVAHLSNEDGVYIGKYYKESYMEHYAQNKYYEGLDIGSTATAVGFCLGMLITAGIRRAVNCVSHHYENKNKDA